METWYVVEYSYSKLESDNIFYKGRKELDTFDELEEFVAVVYFMSNSKEKLSNYQQCQLFKKHLGREGKFVSLIKIYKYMKKEIKLKNNKIDCQITVNN
jgi:hypothetical protein